MARTGLRRPVEVAVIGGGFCGAFFAVQLARKTTVPANITVVEPRENLGGGVAYSSPDPAHRVNVPAGRMSLFTDDPDHFDAWFRNGGELADDPEALWPTGHAYPRRAAFGRYMAALLASESHRHEGVTIAHLQDAASSIMKHHDHYTIDLKNGGSVQAELVVLAASHPPPSLPASLAAQLGDDPAVVANPWLPEALDDVRPDDDVLVIGTGLTMADVIASLARRGHTGHITAFSRRGLRSRGHDYSCPRPDLFSGGALPRSAIGLLRTLRGEIAGAATRSIPWQAVIDDVRANGQRIWGQLNLVEQSRLLRHLRVYWDVHRYRIAPQVEAALQRRQRDGSLRVLSASLQSATRVDGRIEIMLRPRRAPAGTVERIAVDKIIVTTGPAHGAVLRQNAALGSLAAAGLIQADPLGLGLAVNAASEAVRPDGGSDPSLRVVGPLARGYFGELMGMPQVSGHATEVAEGVAGWLAKAKVEAEAVLF